MRTFYRNFVMAGVLSLGLAACGDDVTIPAPPPPPPAPETPNITTFTVAPTSATIAPGTFVQASHTLVTKAGVTGTVTWNSSNPAVATVDATGLITAVAQGAAVVTATATAGGQTATASVGVTVRPIQPAQVSIKSITTGLTTLPVNVSNVFGQIEITLNFDPGEQIVDSVAVFIGNKRAAKQSYATSPSAGDIVLSVNTANFTKNSTTGVATVDYQNGATTISAAVYPRGASATATNSVAIVLNNADSWAADITKPTATANNAGGLTFWGGPTAGGIVSATLYPVIYTPGRSITTVTWGVGGCPTVVQTALPFMRTWGYTAAGAQSPCTAYQYTGGARDNVAVTSANDNANNSYPLTPLIANTVVLGSTPDSLRLDYVGPSTVSTPLSAGAHGFNWVNASWAFAPASPTVTDAGVGGLASTWQAFVCSACASATPTYTTAVSTGANLAETNTNVVATDGYTLRATGADRLGNVANSAVSTQFGVDKTNPMIRYPTTTTLANVRTYPAGDTVTVVTAPAAGSPLTLWAVEAIDNRAGLFDTPASGTTRGVDQTVIRLAPAAIGTNVSVSGDDNYAVVLVDGWRQTVAVPVWGSAAGQTNTTVGYYTYTATIRDRAGNSVGLAGADTTATAQRRYAIDPAAPQVTGIGMPATFGTDLLNLSGTFTIAAQDDLEVIDTRMGISFPDAVTGAVVPEQPIIFPYSSFANVGIRYDGTLAGAIAAASNLTTPVGASVTTPDFWAGIQVLCSAGCADPGPNAGFTITGEPVVAGATYKPDSASANVIDVFGTASATLTAPILSTSIPATTELSANVYDGVGSITGNGIQVQYLSANTIRQVSSFSVTLPQLARLHAFRLIGSEWVYQGTVQGSAGVGSDNGLERFWDYNFGSLIGTSGATYAIVAVYNGPVAAARGTALWYQFVRP